MVGAPHARQPFRAGRAQAEQQASAEETAVVAEQKERQVLDRLGAGHAPMPSLPSIAL